MICNFKGPGTPPNEIAVIAQKDSEVDVEWTTPDIANGKITGYVVHYGETLEGTAKLLSVVFSCSNFLHIFEILNFVTFTG